MIDVRINLRCDGCSVLFWPEHWDGGDDEDRVRALLRTAEGDGWKVNRLARDVYYGKAWCGRCREDKCQRCHGRGYYPNFKNWDSYHGEPERVECEVCDGRGY